MNIFLHETEKRGGIVIGLTRGKFIYSRTDWKDMCNFSASIELFIWEGQWGG